MSRYEIMVIFAQLNVIASKERQLLGLGIKSCRPEAPTVSTTSKAKDLKQTSTQSLSLPEVLTLPFVLV